MINGNRSELGVVRYGKIQIRVLHTIFVNFVSFFRAEEIGENRRISARCDGRKIIFSNPLINPLFNPYFQLYQRSFVRVTY